MYGGFDAFFFFNNTLARRLARLRAVPASRSLGVFALVALAKDLAQAPLAPRVCGAESRRSVAASRVSDDATRRDAIPDTTPPRA